MNQKIKGLKSGIKRKSSKIARLLEPELEAKKTKSQGTNTVIEGMMQGKNIVVIHERSGMAFKGKRYLGLEDHCKKKTAGHSNFYVEVPVQNKLCSAVTKKEIQKKAKLIGSVVCAVAGSSSDSKERELLYTELIKQNKDVFKNPIRNAGFDLMETLTPDQTANM